MTEHPPAPSTCQKCGKSIVSDLATWMVESDEELDDICQCSPFAAASSAPRSALSAARVREIEARVARATEGPWAWANTAEKDYGANVGAGVFAENDTDCRHPIAGDVRDEHGEYYVDQGVAEMRHPNCASDAQFIAHARQDVPWLIEQVAALTADRDRLAQRVAELEACLARFADDDDPCWFDHHGNCQAHFLGNPCQVAEARKLLGLTPSETPNG